MSATAWVSAAEPDRQHQMVSCTCVSLSVTRFAMYAPVVVLLSAARMTPSLKLIAILRVVRRCEAAVGRDVHRGTQTVKLLVAW